MRHQRRDDPPPGPFTARLARGDDWTSSIDLTWGAHGRHGTVRSFDGRPLDPPVRLAFDEEQLLAHLAATADAALSVHPDVADPLERAFMVFTRQLDAHLRSEAGPGAEITLRNGALRVDHGRRPVSDLDDLPPGRYEWRA